MKTKLWPTAKALLVLTMLTVFPSVLCASDDYSISGATTVYDFSSASDADAYEVYPNSAKDGVAISDGVLTTNATHEYKIIFPSTTPITDNYMVSVDMKNGEGKVSAGLYLQASNATDAEACITSYEVHVEKEAGSNTYSVGLHGFQTSHGYDGTLKWSDPVTITDEWATLKVVMKDGMFHVFFGNMETPVIEVNRTVAWSGDMGIRSYYQEGRFDNFTIQSDEYKADRYSVSGEKVVFDFSSAADANYINIYPATGKNGVTIADGVLQTDADQEYKIMFPSENPITDNYMVSVDMKCGSSLSAGLYLQASDISDAEARLTSYEVHVEYNAGSGGYVIGLHGFQSSHGYDGTLIWSDPVIITDEWMTLKVVMKDGMFYVFLGDMETPVFSVHRTAVWTGIMGIRNYHSEGTFDNFTIQSAEYKKKQAKEGYEVAGDIVVYDFSSSADADAYKVYSPEGKDGVTISDGVLHTDANQEYKIMFPSENPITDNYMVSVDMKCGSSLSAGLYLQASDISDAEARLTSYEVHVEYNAGSGGYVIGLHGFQSSHGYDGTLIWSDPVIITDEWMTLKVVMKDGMFYVFLGDMETPVFSVHRTAVWTGIMGIRNYHSEGTFDNFTIQSAEYKKKAKETYEVAGETVVYDFSSDPKAFEVYPSASAASVTVADGVLSVSDDQQYKVIFPSTTPLKDEFMASVDLKGGSTAVAGGLYLFIDDPREGGDFLNAYNVFVSHEDGTNSYQPTLYAFRSDAGYNGTLATGSAYTSSDEWVTLKVVVKNGTLYAFLGDQTDPCITYTLSEELSGNIGLRSYYNHSVFDNLTIQSLQYKNAMKTFDVTIGSTGYATFYDSSSAYRLPEGVTASTYTYSTADGLHTPTADAVIIAADQGVVLKAEPGSYQLVSTSAIIARDEASMLFGSDEAVTTTGDAKKFYRLSLDAENTEGSIGFYWGAENGSAFTNAAHKAYLAIPEDLLAADAKAFLLNGTTGINEEIVVKDNEQAPIFNLQGQRVGNGYSGIVIINGKKARK